MLLLDRLLLLKQSVDMRLAKSIFVFITDLQKTAEARSSRFELLSSSKNRLRQPKEHHPWAHLDSKLEKKIRKERKSTCRGGIKLAAASD